MIDMMVRIFRMDAWPSANCKWLAVALARRCGNESGVCWASQETLAEDTLLSPKTIQRCLKAMEDAKLIHRVKRPKTDDGHAQTDLIQLRLPEITLKPVGETPPDTVTGGPCGQSVDNTPGTTGHSDRRPPVTESTKESLIEESKHARAHVDRQWPVNESSQIDFEEAAKWIWEEGSEQSRKRSDIQAVEKSLKDLYSTKARGIHPADWFRDVLAGVGAYCGSETATKHDGRYCFGLHRLLVQQGFITRWIPQARQQRVRKELDLSTPQNPSRDMMKVFMAGWAKSGFWPDSQGPTPGEPGCRVDLDLQAEYGATEAEHIRIQSRLVRIFQETGRWNREWGPKPGEDGCLVMAAALEPVASQAKKDDSGGDLFNDGPDDEGTNT